MRDKHKSQFGLPHTCGESAEVSKPAAVRIGEEILLLAGKAGEKGLTINEAEDSIGDHKGHSVSPRFIVLVKKGLLVRVIDEYGAPTKRHPRGRPIFKTRFDEKTRRCVVIHWLPEFAPTAEGFDEGEKVCA